LYKDTSFQQRRVDLTQELKWMYLVNFTLRYDESQVCFWDMMGRIKVCLETRDSVISRPCNVFDIQAVRRDQWRDQQFQVKGDRLIWVQATSSNLAASHGATAGPRNAGPDVPTPHARENHTRPAPPRRSIQLVGVRRAGLPGVAATCSHERSAAIHCITFIHYITFIHCITFQFLSCTHMGLQDSRLQIRLVSPANQTSILRKMRRLHVCIYHPQVCMAPFKYFENFENGRPYWSQHVRVALQTQPAAVRPIKSAPFDGHSS